MAHLTAKLISLDGKGGQPQNINLYFVKYIISNKGNRSSAFLLRDIFQCFWIGNAQFSLVTQSCPNLWPHGLQHVRPPCPSPTPAIYPNSCPLSRWCHPTISSSVIPISSCPPFFIASGYFEMSQPFASGDQSIGASTSVLPVNTRTALL